MRSDLNFNRLLCVANSDLGIQCRNQCQSYYKPEIQHLRHYYDLLDSRTLLRQGCQQYREISLYHKIPSLMSSWHRIYIYRIRVIFEFWALTEVGNNKGYQRLQNTEIALIVRCSFCICIPLNTMYYKPIGNYETVTVTQIGTSFSISQFAGLYYLELYPTCCIHMADYNPKHCRFKLHYTKTLLIYTKTFYTLLGWKWSSNSPVFGYLSCFIWVLKSGKDNFPTVSDTWIRSGSSHISRRERK